jgi:hypothetical protein
LTTDAFRVPLSKSISRAITEPTSTSPRRVTLPFGASMEESEIPASCAITMSPCEDETVPRVWAGGLSIRMSPSW